MADTVSMESTIMQQVTIKMRELKISHTEMAARSGVPIRTLRRWICGDPPAAFSDLEAILKILDLEVK